MGYRIASFNIQKFSRDASKSKEGSDSRKDLEMLARIIIENAFDIIAIQEIYHAEALKALMEQMSGQYAERLLIRVKDLGHFNLNARVNDSHGYRTKQWEGRWAAPVSPNGGRIAEGYAFLWNRGKIKLVTNRDGDSFQPRIEDARDVKKLVRPPFLGRFMPINGRYEIRLINTHIVYARPSMQLEEDIEEAKEGVEFEAPNIEQDDIDLRKKEFETLIKSVYVPFSEKQYDIRHQDTKARLLTPYTFLLGDYNLNLSTVRGLSSARLTPELERMEIHSKDNMCIVTVGHELTTLRGKPRDEEKQILVRYDPIVDHHLANNYDHFSYDSNRLRNHQIAYPETGRIFAFQNYKDTEVETSFEIYRRRVSDHIPIFLDFDVKKRPQ